MPSDESPDGSSFGEPPAYATPRVLFAAVLCLVGAVAQGDLVVVPAGKKHNFVNTGANPLILYTVYGPPEHADGAVHKTKEEADRLEEEGKDEPPTS